MPRQPLPRFTFAFIAVLVLIATFCQGQKSTDHISRYIATYKNQALRQMNEFGIPASVILAQAIFESGAGMSELAKRSNNHFGIKCHSAWQGDTVAKTDDAENECFRKYKRVSDSYRDHSLFLSSRPWYAPLFTHRISDYRSWCLGLKTAGYATCPDYAQQLISIIKKYRLYELDTNFPMQTRTLAVTQTHELKDTRIHNYSKTLIEFTENNLLFSNEYDYYIRSLDIIAGEADDEFIMAKK